MICIDVWRIKSLIAQTIFRRRPIRSIAKKKKNGRTQKIRSGATNRRPGKISSNHDSISLPTGGAPAGGEFLGAILSAFATLFRAVLRQGENARSIRRIGKRLDEHQRGHVRLAHRAIPLGAIIQDLGLTSSSLARLPGTGRRPPQSDSLVLGGFGAAFVVGLGCGKTGRTGARNTPRALVLWDVNVGEGNSKEFPGGHALDGPATTERGRIMIAGCSFGCW